MEIAWIGTGIMGAPMARRLLAAGHRLRVYNRTAARAQALAGAGAVVASSAAEAARGAEFVFIMVPDTADVEAVAAGIRPVLSPGQLVVDMSTVAPAAERRIAEELKPLGVEYLDAPVSGGDKGAVEGTLTIMVGASLPGFARVEPLLACLGRRITHMGPVGAGQTTKLANQIAVALTLQAAAEALLLAKSGGLDPARVLDAIGAGAAASWQLSNLGPKIIDRDYRPGFFIKLMRKDLRLVGEAAAQGGVALPGHALMTMMFNAARSLGHDDDGTQAVAAALQKLAQA